MLTVIKIGGNIIDDAGKLEAFICDFNKVEGPKILVHGGGKLAAQIGLKLGIQPQYINGRRKTDMQTLELVTMVYGGLINKNIVAALQSKGCNAIGLTGADAGVINAIKRPVVDIDYGFVGDMTDTSIDTKILTSMLDMGLVPVLASLTHDRNGCMLNTNADTIAQEVAKAMTATMDVQLIYCFEKEGVLKNADDESAIIHSISVRDFDELICAGVISGGMIPKLENACNAVRCGVKRVAIGNAASLQDILSGKTGTEVL